MRWLVLAFAVVAGLAQSQQPDPKSTATRRGAENDQRGTANFPPVVEVIASQHAKSEASENATERKEKLQLDRDLVHFTSGLRDLTGVLAVVGLLQLIVFGLQARRLRQTVDQMRSSEQRQLRAYVFPLVANIRNFGTQDCIQATVTFRNTGQTPAYKVRTRFFVTASEFPLRTKLPEPELGEETRSSGSLGPGSEKHVVVDAAKPLIPEHCAQVVQGVAAVYVYGEVTYEDAFGIARHTPFRYYYGGNTGANPSGSLSVHPDGNDAN